MENIKGIQELLQDKPLSLVDYWAVDWNYDGKTFKSIWHASAEWAAIYSQYQGLLAENYALENIPSQ